VTAGKVCIVTGASSGIGEATARALARAGATVVLAARREDLLARFAEEIGERATWMRCDVTRQEDLQALRDHVAETHGRCDVLVNNAGVPGGGRFADLSIERIRLVTETNLMSVMVSTKLFLPMLLEAKGHVVNVASLAGRYALPGASVYTAAKHGVVALSESLSYTTESGIRVTAVCPGLVHTPSFPHVRPPRLLTVTAEQVAQRIVRVVGEGRVGTVCIPAWAGPLAAVPILAPRLFRFVAGWIAERYWSRQEARPASKERQNR
jgi:NAD(P)-dependent dehydrogenase (short-subunit alcohol dehydrogenase family)